MVKILTGLLVMFTLTAPAAAAPILIGDAYSVSFHAQTWQGDSPAWGPLPDVVMDGVLTAVNASGQFWDPHYQEFSNGGGMVLDITGTLTVDCLGITGCVAGSYAMSFAQPSPSNDGWLLDALTHQPIFLAFALNGTSGGGVFNNRLYTLLSAPSVYLPMSWTSSAPQAVPDASSSLLLLTMGIGSLVGLRRRAAATDGRTIRSESLNNSTGS